MTTSFIQLVTPPTSTRWNRKLSFVWSRRHVGGVNSVSGVIFSDGVFVFSLRCVAVACVALTWLYILCFSWLFKTWQFWQFSALQHSCIWNDLRDCYCRISSAKLSFIHIRAINKPQINAYDTATCRSSGVSAIEGIGSYVLNADSGRSADTPME